ncbi:MAG: TadE/TadG family type IV pilus assembly protein [Planctomycetota bacterium]|jgi:hypothetical protein|nr:TadE/TadG family type IV pilus assembly protein [Planctomycetota bacterium]
MKFWSRFPGRLLREERGQAMAEFAIVFPIQLFVTLAIMQYSLLVMGRTVVEHAGHAAARCVLLKPQGVYTNSDAERAAAFVCAPITGHSMGVVGAAPTPVLLPGWGAQPKSRKSMRKTRVIILDDGSAGSGQVRVRVEHDFQLVVPLANHFFAFPWKTFRYLGGIGGPADTPVENALAAKYGSPHLLLSHEVRIPKTWKE